MVDGGGSGAEESLARVGGVNAGGSGVDEEGEGDRASASVGASATDDGSLPFTGLFIGGLLLVGRALAAAGLGLRRLAR